MSLKFKEEVESEKYKCGVISLERWRRLKTEHKGDKVLGSALYFLFGTHSVNSSVGSAVCSATLDTMNSSTHR